MHRQTCTNLPIHRQSTNTMPTRDQSANPSPISQAITNLPISCQSWTNPLQIPCQSANPLPICQCNVNPSILAQIISPILIHDLYTDSHTICKITSNPRPSRQSNANRGHIHRFITDPPIRYQYLPTKCISLTNLPICQFKTTPPIQCYNITDRTLRTSVSAHHQNWIVTDRQDIATH